uniref:Uncharacterized protein n=1 Tax=Arundo donax TaxID=35708 RepID=A0A0A9EF76_ARUDO
MSNSCIRHRNYVYVIVTKILIGDGSIYLFMNLTYIFLFDELSLYLRIGTYGK